METTIKIPNREIALAAFDRLRREKRKDAALRLAGCMIRGTYISLGIGDTDWEIDTALHKCGGEPKTGYGHMAHFHFDGETEMETETTTARPTRSLPRSATPSATFIPEWEKP